jgi:NADPH2:quinone reductase
LMLKKRLTIVGTMLRGRPIEEKIQATRHFSSQVLPWFKRGIVRPVVDSSFGFEAFPKAYARLESNEVFGKVVLDLG